MRVVVTGAAGLLGSWLADELRREGHSVVGVDNLIGGYRDNISGEFKCDDITDLEAMVKSCVGAEVVYHCAALAYEGLSVFSPSMISNNIFTGTVTLATAAIKCRVKRFVNFSSMARFGKNMVPYTETMTPRPVDPYGLAKHAAEQQLNLLGEIHGMTVVHCVPHNVIGARQRYEDSYRNVASIMVNRMLQGQQPIIYGDGRQRRCFSFVQDVLSVITKLLDAKVQHGEVFNVGPDENPVTINQLAESIAALLDFDLKPEYHAARPCEIHAAYCSSNKIRRRFGYKTKTTLEEGLWTIIDYVRKRGTRPFDYSLPIELCESPHVPRVWKERLL